MTHPLKSVLRLYLLKQELDLDLRSIFFTDIRPSYISYPTRLKSIAFGLVTKVTDIGHGSTRLWLGPPQEPPGPAPKCTSIC